MNGEDLPASPSRPRSAGSGPGNASGAAKPAWGQPPAKTVQHAAAAAWQRPAAGQGTGGVQAAKPAGPAWLNQ